MVSPKNRLLKRLPSGSFATSTPRMAVTNKSMVAPNDAPSMSTKNYPQKKAATLVTSEPVQAFKKDNSSQDESDDEVNLYKSKIPNRVLKGMYNWKSRAQLQLAVNNLEKEEKQHDEKHHLYHSESPHANRREPTIFSGMGNS